VSWRSRSSVAGRVGLTETYPGRRAPWALPSILQGCGGWGPCDAFHAAAALNILDAGDNEGHGGRGKSHDGQNVVLVHAGSPSGEAANLAQGDLDEGRERVAGAVQSRDRLARAVRDGDENLSSFLYSLHLLVLRNSGLEIVVEDLRILLGDGACLVEHPSALGAHAHLSEHVDIDDDGARGWGEVGVCLPEEAAVNEGAFDSPSETSKGSPRTTVKSELVEPGTAPGHVAAVEDDRDLVDVGHGVVKAGETSALRRQMRPSASTSVVRRVGMNGVSSFFQGTTLEVSRKEVPAVGKVRRTRKGWFCSPTGR
jgi:hypothetical protein